MSLQDNKKAKTIIEENLYMTIAVSNKKGEPWIANLYYIHDKDYNFYWYSPKNSIHSKTINENPSAALSIFNSTSTKDDVGALYLKAHAQEVTDRKELVKAMILYAAKMLRTKFINKAGVKSLLIKHKTLKVCRN